VLQLELLLLRLLLGGGVLFETVWLGVGEEGGVAFLEAGLDAAVFAGLAAGTGLDVADELNPELAMIVSSSSAFLQKAPLVWHDRSSPLLAVS